jgi:prephenate dehydrogenase
MNARDHDAALAMLSHAPQLLAVALTNVAGRRHPASRQRLALGAGGFRDMTRIASSPFGVWKDIIEENPTEIRRALRLLVKELQRYEQLMGRAGRGLSVAFAKAAELRGSIPRGMKGYRSPLIERTVFVPDEPGMLAKLTGELGRSRINIKDIELLKVREGTGGTFRLAFESESDARRSERILERAFSSRRRD